MPNLYKGFMAPFQSMATGSTDLLSTLFGWITELLVKFLDWWAEYWPKLAEIVSIVLQAIGDFWQQHGQDVIAFVTTLFEGIGTIFGDAMNIISDIITFTLALVKGDWQGAWNAIGQFVHDIWVAIVDFVSNGAKLVVRGIQVIFDVAGNLPGEVGQVFQRTSVGLGKALTDIDSFAGKLKEFFAVQYTGAKSTGDAYQKLLDDQAKAYESNQRRMKIQEFLGGIKGSLQNFKFDLPDFKGFFEKFIPEDTGIPDYMKDWGGIADDLANKLEDDGKEAKKAADETKKFADALRGLSAAGVSVLDFFVETNPAMIAFSAAVSVIRSKIADLALAIAANNDQLKAAKAELVGMQDALESTKGQLSDAQDVLGKLKDRLSDLQDELTKAKQKLQDFASPKLKGQTLLEDQIGAIQFQLKRIDMAQLMGLPLDAVISRFPVLREGMEGFLRTLPLTKDALSKVLEAFQFKKELGIDEQARKLKESAENVSKELTYDEAQKGIVDTKAQIEALTKSIQLQEQSIVNQQNVIDSLNASIKVQEQAMKNQERVIAAIEASAAAMNEQMAIYQKNLQEAEAKQNLVNTALQTAYKWFLEDRYKVAEMGAEGERVAGVMDIKTQELLASITAAATDTTSISTETLAAMVTNYQSEMAKALQEIANVQGALNAIPRDIYTTVHVSTEGAVPVTASVAEGGPQASGSFGWVTKPTHFLAGEAGPEPYWFGGASSQTPFPGGDTITVIVKAPIYGVNQLEDVIVSSIDQAKRRGRL
jgi:septal ring factor EnvC (AmiA/AmiB activator)